jgi:hypothetical protein
MSAGADADRGDYRPVEVAAELAVGSDCAQLPREIVLLPLSLTVAEAAAELEAINRDDQHMLQDLERMTLAAEARTAHVERLQRRLEAADLPGVVLGFLRQVVRGEVLTDATRDQEIRTFVAKHATPEVRAVCDRLMAAHRGFTRPRFDTVIEWVDQMDRRLSTMTEADRNTSVMGRGTVTLSALAEVLANLLIEWERQSAVAAGPDDDGLQSDHRRREREC